MAKMPREPRSGKKRSPKEKSAGRAPGEDPRKTILEPLLRATKAQRERWTEIAKTITELRLKGNEAFDELYEVVDEVVSAEPPLYVGGGMRSEKDFIAKMLPGETRRSVWRNRLVAVAFTPKDEDDLGLTWLEEVARYVMELSGTTALPRALDLDRLRIPVEGSDGRKLRKIARSCSFEEVRAARSALGKTKKRPATEAERMLAQAIQRSAKLRVVKVRAPGGRASFLSVPLEHIDELGKVLTKVRLPAASTSPKKPRGKGAGG